MANTGKFIQLTHTVNRQHRLVTVNVDEISSVGTTYTYGTDYYVEMRNGTRYWLTEQSYRELQERLKGQ